MDPLPERNINSTPFAYCGNNPIVFTDFIGKSRVWFSKTTGYSYQATEIQGSFLSSVIGFVPFGGYATTVGESLANLNPYLKSWQITQSRVQDINGEIANYNDIIGQAMDFMKESKLLIV